MRSRSPLGSLWWHHRHWVTSGGRWWGALPTAVGVGDEVEQVELLVWLEGHRRISPVSGSTWLPSTRRRLGRAVGSARRAARWCSASCWARVVTSLP